LRQRHPPPSPRLRSPSRTSPSRVLRAMATRARLTRANRSPTVPTPRTAPTGPLPAIPTAASPPRADRRGRVAPLTIGLTGGIAAGKSEALAAFRRLGAGGLSSDAVVHDLLEGDPLRAELTARWGPEVAPEDAPTDRGKIGGIVFADPEELKW